MGDAAQLPPAVKIEIDLRLQAERHRSPAFDQARFRQLSAQLAFCDLNKLKEAILSKPLWPKFEPRFENKVTLANEFDDRSDCA